MATRKCLDPLLALRGGDVRKPQGMGRRKGWGPHDASAGLRRMGLGFIVLPAITMLEGGSCPPLPPLAAAKSS